MLKMNFGGIGLKKAAPTDNQTADKKEDANSTKPGAKQPPGTKSGTEKAKTGPQPSKAPPTEPLRNQGGGEGIKREQKQDKGDKEDYESKAHKERYKPVPTRRVLDMKKAEAFQVGLRLGFGNLFIMMFLPD